MVTDDYYAAVHIVGNDRYLLLGTVLLQATYAIDTLFPKQASDMALVIG